MDTREHAHADLVCWSDVPIVFSPSWIQTRNRRRDSRDVALQNPRGDQRVSRCFGVTSRCPWGHSEAMHCCACKFRTRWPCAIGIDAGYRCSSCLLWARLPAAAGTLVALSEMGRPTSTTDIHLGIGPCARIVDVSWLHGAERGAFRVEFIMVHIVMDQPRGTLPVVP